MLAGKTLIVTGAASGIGAASAAHLAALGARVLAVDRQQPAQPVGEFFQADLADPASIERLVAALPAGAHGLANIAGLPPTRPAEDVLAVNLVGLKALTTRLVPRLADGASIVNLASLAGLGWPQPEAKAAMADVLAAGQVPLLVGGTMLYFRALLGGLAELPAADPRIRADIAVLAEREGWAGVHRRLAEVDPVGAARIDPANRQRVQRALEVYLASGRTLSSLHAQQLVPDDLPCRFLQLAMLPQNRARLHQRIESRFRAMLADGFLDEVAALRGRGDLHPDLPSMRCVGYRQAWEYLGGHGDVGSLVERVTAATRQLAKRQLTWLRNWAGLVMLPGDESDEVMALAAALKAIDAAST